MKNYYDYGCGKGENYGGKGNEYDYNKKLNEYSNYEYYNFKRKCEKEYEDEDYKDHDDEYDCKHEKKHCAKVYTVNKYDHKNKDEDRKDDKYGYDCKCDKYDHGDKENCKRGHDDHGDKENCKRDHDFCECFCFKICIPPFPFRHK